MKPMNANDFLPRTGDERAQVFPLIKGRVNQTSGSTWHCEMIYCVTAGSFDIVFETGDDAVTIDMEDGNVFWVGNDATIDLTDTTGKFHLSR